MTAIYARQSVDRADSISIESQIEFCKYEARGEKCRIYTDRGFSGKDTNRPNFRVLMEDIKNGEINRVIVYKLDRISRSILDFSSMMAEFDKYHVDFVSSTEKFDTSSPMGRAMLNICIVFAQLERETIQKRVADAYYARSRRSFYMGGPVPYGFLLEPITIDGKKTSKYAAREDEAEVVRFIYEMYAKPDISYGDIISALQQRGITKRGKDWARPRIADILRNPIYVRADLDVYKFFESQGAVITNQPEDFIGTNGCYYYSGKDAQGRKTTDMNGNCIVLAPHQGIVDSEIWLTCRKKCLRSKQVQPPQKAKNTWLAGKVKCARCGYALVDKRYKGKEVRYLLCSHRMNAKACDGAGSLHTDEIEQIIYDQMRQKLAEFTSLHKKKHERVDPELTALQLELTACDKEMASLLERLPEASDSLFKHINRRVEELDTLRADLTCRIAELTSRNKVQVSEITSHPENWEHLSFADRRIVLDQLVNVIRIADDKITIEWRV